MCEILPKCIKFVCNYLKNSSATPDQLPGLRPWTPLGTSIPQTPCGFVPHPKPPSAAYVFNTRSIRVSSSDDLQWPWKVGRESPFFFQRISICTLVPFWPTIKFGMVTPVWEERDCNESTTPPFQGLVGWFGAGPQHSPVWGFLKLCLHPLLYNDQIRHGYTCGEFLLGEGGSATVTTYTAQMRRAVCHRQPSFFYFKVN